MDLLIESRVVLSEDVLVDFIEMFEVVRDNQFAIGDRLIELVSMLGDKTGVINYLAGHLSVSASVLYDYYRVSERWLPKYRQMYQSLDWTIYRNSDPVVDKELLDKALDYGWNATRFKREKYPAIICPFNMIRRLMSWVEELLEKPDVYAEDKSELERMHKRLGEIVNKYEEQD